MDPLSHRCYMQKCDSITPGSNQGIKIFLVTLNKGNLLWGFNENYEETTKISRECLYNTEQEATITFTTGKERDGYYKISKGRRDGRM